MSEPASTTVGTVVGIKAFLNSVLYKFLLSPYFAATVASVVVMLMTMPKTKRQQFIALLVTFCASIYGGAAVIDYYNLETVFSTVSKGGIYLLCGLPAWVILRGFFAYTERDKNKGILDYIREVRQAWKGE